MKTCYVCKEKKVEILLDFGMQPICNNFLRDADEEEYKHPLIVGQCQACGLLQLVDPAPAIKLKPRYDWITYSEPEEHLDKLADIIAGLKGLNKKSKICGISFKDNSLLERLKKRGLQNSWQLDLKKDLGIKYLNIGVETIQDKFTQKMAEKIAQKYGRQDVIIARHILEHTHDTLDFMAALKELLNPQGYIVIEVPDCKRALEQLDYTVIWEEHTLYFTPETFHQSVISNGFSFVYFENFPYTLENSLVGIVQPKKYSIVSLPEKNILEKERYTALVFSERLDKKRNALKQFLSKYRREGRIALFGAGHLACTFINLMGLKRYIELVIDNNPNKRYLFMPGSCIPIVGSSALTKKNIKLCLLSLNPRNEEKIIQKLQSFINNGGVFLSIFSDSKRSLPIEGLSQTPKITNMRQSTSGVYYSDDKLIKVGSEEVKFLKDSAKHNEHQRSRLCTHKDVNDELHEMIIVHTKDIYIRPHKHLNKSESFHLIEGSADVIIFDESGDINEVIRMGDYLSGRKFYYRMAESYYHTLLINSDYIVFHETTKGPFKKSDTVFAPWSPEEHESVAIKKFKENLARRVKKFQCLYK